MLEVREVQNRVSEGCFAVHDPTFANIGGEINMPRKKAEAGFEVGSGKLRAAHFGWISESVGLW
jgi:hypothetical protein